MAQSALTRSSIGAALFWVKGAQPTTWEKWIITTKLAISAKENIQGEKLLRPKPTAEELDYQQEPLYEPALPDETTAEKRQREQQNIKRKEDQGPMIDNSKWDEIDNKVKNLIYLSLGTEGTNIFNQRNPHRLNKMNHRRTSNTTTVHIRQISIYPMHTKPRRIARTIPLQNKAKSNTL